MTLGQREVVGGTRGGQRIGNHIGDINGEVNTGGTKKITTV